MIENPRILLIDDDAVDRKAVMRVIGRDFYVREAPDGRSGLKLLKDEEFDCVLLDYFLPDFDGLDLLRIISSGEGGGLCSGDHVDRPG